MPIICPSCIQQGDSFPGHMGNSTGKTQKSGTLGAFVKAGNVDTICILFGDVDPTVEKLYHSDQSCIIRTKAVSFGPWLCVSSFPAWTCFLPIN